MSKAIVGLAGLVCAVLAVRFVLVCREPEVIPIEIGEVHFTDKYNPEASAYRFIRSKGW